jgi:plasmid stabilization system protein ParE
MKLRFTRRAVADLVEIADYLHARNPAAARRVRATIYDSLQSRANRYYLHGYVWCDGMISGVLAHTCRHGPPPHRIKVCVTKKGNEKFWRAIEEAALAATARGERYG